MDEIVRNNTGAADRKIVRHDPRMHIAVAPGLLDKPQTVVREPGESDERYKSRCDLLAALIDRAKQQS